MSMDAIAKEWLMARKIISDALYELGVNQPISTAEAVIARLGSHSPPILLQVTPPEIETLTDWLEGEFRAACANDVKRLTESLLMLKVGKDQGDSPDAMGRAIASFVKGLILGDQPVTVPTENN